ncbi:MAG: exodeoxyribonuclease VII large subunit [Clostridia bacterium]|nr:exodeoxyribonuclease VII large subunit [Clostridia bacterium]
MSYKPVTVTQLSTYLKQIFDAEELLHNISVVGELSGYSNVRGTAYFTLKDAGSALSCVCFTATEFVGFKNGDSVIVVGTPRYYVKGGKLNFNVTHIEHYGESVLYKQFLELKSRLEALGYFESSHKKSLPQNIRRIGVVSSEGGAVIQDIINVRTRRNPNIDIVLYPVKVQGDGAEVEIANAIQALDEYDVDVIVVARGGGSMEDLQPFNTEIVATATYNCKKFIMSAVGHETDYTIIDFCSDMRAPTPSAAAELLCDNISDKKEHVLNLVSLLNKSIINYYENKFNGLHIAKNALDKAYDYMIQDTLSVENRVIEAFIKAFKNYFEIKQIELNHKVDLLGKLNPNEVLKLGYSTIRTSKGYVTSKSDVGVGDEIEVSVKDGSIMATVVDVR